MKEQMFFFGRNELIRLRNQHKTPCCLYINIQHIAQEFTKVCLINSTTILKGGLIYPWSINGWSFTFHQLSLLAILAMH